MDSTQRKPRLALFGMGTLGAGNISVPVMIDLFGRLTADFDVIFYSFILIDTSETPPSIVVRQPMRWWLPGRVKYFFMMVRCLVDHFLNPFSLLFAVSVYPTGKWAVVLGRIIKRPVIVQLISTEGGTRSTPSFGNLTVPWLKDITLHVCAHADFIVPVADYQRNIAEQNLNPRNAMVVLPLRINPAKFPFKKRRISYPVQFIQIAFYSPLKDQDTMFAAFAQVSKQMDCYLTVVGEGFNTAEVTNKMRQLEIADKVTFTGYLKNEALRQQMMNTHILLHTALFETGCAVVQEAMASGVVVCGSRVGLLDDIGESYAATFNPGDVAEMTETIIRLVNDPERYDRLADNAYQWITKYDAVWSYHRYKAFILDVINGDLPRK